MTFWRLVRLASFAALVAGCALVPEPEVEDRANPDDVDGFARQVRENLQDHEWQALLASSNPGYFREQVVENGIPEPWYLARLLGLTDADNNIQSGDELGWDDLDRIVIATLAPTGSDGPPYHYTGLATLLDGTELSLNAWVSRVQGRFVLTTDPND